MKLFDTMAVIDCIKKEKNERILIHEATVFEMLKNKTDSERRRQLKNIINYCERTDSTFLKSVEQAELLWDDDFISYIKALEMCKATAYKLADMMFSFLAILLTLIQLFKAKDYGETRIANAQNLLVANQKVIETAKANFLELIYMDLFNESAEKTDNDYMNLYNVFVGLINNHTSDAKHKLKIVNSLSVNEMINQGINTKTRIDFINQYVNNFLEFHSNTDINHKFYRAYLTYLFTQKQKVETNDFIDMSIACSAYTNNLALVTCDANTTNAYSSLISIEKYVS